MHEPALGAVFAAASCEVVTEAVFSHWNQLLNCRLLVLSGMVLAWLSIDRRSSLRSTVLRRPSRVCPLGWDILTSLLVDDLGPVFVGAVLVGLVGLVVLVVCCFIRRLLSPRK